MAIDQLPDRPAPAPRSPAQRRRILVAAVALAYVAVALFAQLVGEDQPDEASLVRLDAFCTALYSDYPGLISSLAGSGGFGPLGDAEGGPLFTGFIDADLAPTEFRDDVAFLTEGLDRAAAGNLGLDGVDVYVQAYDDLLERATPTCDTAGREIQIEDLPSNGLGGD